MAVPATPFQSASATRRAHIRARRDCRRGKQPGCARTVAVPARTVARSRSWPHTAAAPRPTPRAAAAPVPSLRAPGTRRMRIERARRTPSAPSRRRGSCRRSRARASPSGPASSRARARASRGTRRVARLLTRTVGRAIEQRAVRRHHRLRHDGARREQMRELPVIGAGPSGAREIRADAPRAPQMRVVEACLPGQRRRAERVMSAAQIAHLLRVAVGAALAAVDGAPALLAGAEPETNVRAPSRASAVQHAAWATRRAARRTTRRTRRPPRTPPRTPCRSARPARRS